MRSFHPVMSVQEVELESKRERKSVIVGSLPRGFGDADLWCKKKKEKKKIAKNVQIFMVNRFNNEQS